MHLTTTIEQAPGQKRTRPELRLHGAIPWPENATAESLANVRGSLIDVDAGSVVWGANPFRAVATLDVLAPDELDDELLSSVLKERREALLQAPGSWCGGDRIWARFDPHDEAPTVEKSPPKRGDPVPEPVDGPSTILDDLIASAQGRLLLRRKRLSLRVDEMVLEDFGGVEHLAFKPSPGQTTVLVGANGAGKSTLLNAAKLLLYPLTARFNRLPLNSVLGDDDIRNGRDVTRLGITATLGAETVNWRIARAVGFDSTAEVKSSELDATIGRLANIIHAYKPIIVYYSVDRGVRGAALQDGTLKEALPYGMSDFRLFFKWFHAREDLENETRIHDSAHRDPQLEAVRRAVPILIDGFKNLRVQRAPLRMVVTKGASTLYVDQLSDGEKCLLAMVGDIARRLAMANPYADDPLLGGGVILIDEIELHLHPLWQRLVVPALERMFPNCQLILTTHSPQVLSSLHAENVRVLERFEVRPLDRATWRRDTNRILQAAFGDPGRPPEVAVKFDALRDAVDADRHEEARRLIGELTAMIEGDDPDVFFYEQMLPADEASEVTP